MKTKNYLILFFLLLTKNLISQELTLIKDISTHASFKNSDPRGFTEFNGKIYFSANDQVHGRELWVTDGTENGTYMLKDLQSGENEFGPERFINYKDELYFSINNEIWKTNGTEAGTVFVASLGEDTSFGFRSKFTVYKNKLYFSGDSIADGDELWVSDGTQEGTFIFKDINLLESNFSNPNILSKASNPTDLIIYNDKLYFAADDGINGVEIWVTDGTPENTTLALDIRNGSIGSSPSSFTIYKNLLYFAASEGTHGIELWKSDGTTNGTELVKDINFGEDSSIPSYNSSIYGGNGYNQIVILNNKLYFVAEVDNNFTNIGVELWESDGTEAGTKLVKDIFSGSASSSPAYLTVLNNKIYFNATTNYDNGLAYKYLWESDGTGDGTIEVRDVNNNSINYPNYITVFNSKLFFSSVDENFGVELFSFDPNENDTNNEETTNIPDNAFEQYLIDEGFDDVLDDKVLTANITSITALNLSNKGITDLTGIEDFSSLENLDISNNVLNTLNLSENTALLYLFCGDCSLTSIDVSNNINLIELSLFNNALNTIDVSANTNLDALNITNNNFSELNISQNENLTYLSISQNQFTNLDVSANLLLEELYAFTNQLTGLDVSFNTALKALRVQTNKLNYLNIKNGNNSNFTITNGVRDLDTRGNVNLSCIQVDDVAFADTNFTNIDATASFSIDCSAIDGQTFVPDNNFEAALIALNLDTDLDDYVTTANINTLENLDISNLNITDLTGLQDFIALKTLNISNNSGLGNIDVSAQESLEILNCDNVNISELDITKNTALQTLSANNNSLTTIDFSNNFNLKNLSVNNNMFTDFPVDFLYAIQNLDFSNNQITTLETTSMLQLKSLICNNNNLQKLYFSGVFGLTELIANDNNLSVLDLRTGNLEAIESFNITNNENLFCVEVDDVAYAIANLTNKDAQTNYNENCGYFDVTAIPDPLFEQALIDLELDDVIDQSVLTINIKNLKSLLIQNTNIDVLTGLEAFVSLENLTLINLSIDEIDLSTLTNLKELNLFRNLLTELDITKNEDLEVLLASENSLSSIDLSKNTNLQRLNLNYNEFKSTIDLSTNEKLQFLDILGNAQGNQITSIDLTNNPLLEEVQIQENLLTSIDVSSNLNLKRLSVPNNNISTIDVSNNALLEILGVSNNNLTSLNVKANEQLQFLNTEGNNLTCVSVFDVDFANTQFTQFADDTTIFVSDCNNIVMIPDTNFEQKLIDLGLDNVLDNYVTRTNIENLEELEIFTLNSNPNKITDLTGIEAFTSLKKLNISFNNVSNVDLSANILLEEFRAQFCNIDFLQLPNSQTLKILDVFSNNLLDLQLGFYPNLMELQANNNNLTIADVSQNINLEILRLSSNQIGFIDVQNNTKLKELELIDTAISAINLSKNTLLENLNVRNNSLTILDITRNIRLTTFEASANNLTCINTFDVDFANTNWSNNIDAEASFGTDCYTAIPDRDFEQALINKGFDTALDGFIVTSIANNVSFLGLATSNIEDLTGIEAFTALTGLDLKGNNLTSIDLSNNTLLTNLNISNNFRLDRLDISNNKNLDTFEAFNVELTCIKVWDVDYANTNWSDKIDTDIVFSLDCNDVWTVDVDDKTESVLNNVPSLDANNDGKVTIAEAEAFAGELDLSNKNLDDIKGLQAFSGITKLNLSGNNLKDLSALTRKKITIISKTTGKKRDVAAKSSGLETLIISNNSFETLNLEELKNLKIIDLSNNPNVATISIKNGNNANITSFDATNCPNLTCIIVDDKTANYLTNFSKDTKSNFVADLSDCRKSVLSTQEFLNENVNVFPNPVTNFLTIESKIEFDSIEVYNTIGKRILKTTARKIDFSNYTSGIYMMRIIAENKVLFKKIIKN